MIRVLVVDDEVDCRQQAAAALRQAGCEPVAVESGDAALTRLSTDHAIDAMLLDLVMPDRDGMGVLDAMRRQGIAVPVVVALAAPSVDLVAAIIRAGAVDFVEKPCRPERLHTAIANAVRAHRLEAALASSRSAPAGGVAAADFIANDAMTARAVASALGAARTGLPLLIEGEPGTGRQTLARLVHTAAERSSRPLRLVPAASMDPAEVFASGFGGTLVVLGIDRLPPAAQAELARRLDPAVTRPDRTLPRLIATSSARLVDLTRHGRFHGDLFYRLNVHPLYLPPLRARPADIGPLAERLLMRLAAEMGRPVRGLSPAALGLLGRHDWPGNVRELEIRLCRAVALASGDTLEPTDFPDLLAARDGHEAARADLAATAPEAAPEGALLPAERFLTEAGTLTSLAEMERQLIAFALDRYRGRISRVARELGIGRSTLYRKLRDYGLDASLAGDPA